MRSSACARCGQPKLRYQPCPECEGPMRDSGTTWTSEYEQLSAEVARLRDINAKLLAACEAIWASADEGKASQEAWNLVREAIAEAKKGATP